MFEIVDTSLAFSFSFFSSPSNLDQISIDLLGVVCFCSGYAFLSYTRYTAPQHLIDRDFSRGAYMDLVYFGCQRKKDFIPSCWRRKVSVRIFRAVFLYLILGKEAYSYSQGLSSVLFR